MRQYGFRAIARDGRGWAHARETKKAAVSGGLKVDNREASNRVDRSHSMSRRWTGAVMNEKA
jgi:hypothetical protein